MINKLKLVSIINKYYLGVNESVKWDIKDNTLSINFMTPTKDVIGNLTCNNFELEDSELAIYDTKKLQTLISICSGDLLLELEKMPEIVELLSKGEITTKSNHFKNIKSYTLDKHVFNEKTNLEKVNILEQLVKSLDFEKKNLSATYNVDILGV